MVKQIRAKAFISGRVQGVAYRYWTESKASSLGLSGYVRNLPDGRVEAVFQGEPAVVDQMLEMLKQGPPAARVDNVDVARSDAIGGEFEGFMVRY